MAVGAIVSSAPLILPTAVWDWWEIRRHHAGESLKLSIGAPALASEGDLFQAREILAQGTYVLRGFIPRPGWIVVDVGANIGLFAAWAARLMGRGQVIAIEAMPDTYAVLVRNVRTGGLCRTRRSAVEIVPVNCAVSRDEGALVFEYFAENSGVSRLATAAGVEVPADIRPAEHWRPTPISVEARPLDAVLAGAAGLACCTIDLLKIDIEGMELACVEGAADTLRRTSRVVFEYHSADLRDAVSRRLTTLGFIRRAVKPGNAEDNRGVAFWSRSNGGG